MSVKIRVELSGRESQNSAGMAGARAGGGKRREAVLVTQGSYPWVEEKSLKSSPSSRLKCVFKSRVGSSILERWLGGPA